MELSLVRSDNISLSDKAADQISKFIQENKMQKGDRLPNEKRLMEQLNVSRTTIREAMRSLSSRGIVVIRQGSGTYIANLPGVSEDPLGLGFQYDKERVMKDLLELRFIMEPSIAALSAQCASQEDVLHIGLLADEIGARIRGGKDHMEPDIAFHCRIAQSVGNDILNVLFPEIVKGIRMFTTILEDRIINDVSDHHQRIAEAIAKRDGQGAYVAMIAHLDSNRLAIEEYFNMKLHWSFGQRKEHRPDEQED